MLAIRVRESTSTVFGKLLSVLSQRRATNHWGLDGRDSNATLRMTAGRDVKDAIITGNAFGRQTDTIRVYL